MKKKILCVLMLLTILFTAASCSSSNQSKTTPEQVEEAIKKIGYIDDMTFGILSKEGIINEASNLYDQLDEKQKEKVTTYETLAEAKKVLAAKKESRDHAQEFGEKFFLKLAKQFLHPESINLQNVWFYDMEMNDTHMAYYTFQFDVKNSIGVVENVFYGNSMAFLELTDEKLAEFMKGYAVLGSYIGEGETKAMDRTNNIKLDAGKMMDYFRRNR